MASWRNLLPRATRLRGLLFYLLATLVFAAAVLWVALSR